MGGTQSTLPGSMSVESPNPAKPGEGKPRRLTAADPPTKGKHGTDNIWDTFVRTVGMYPDNNCFGKRIQTAEGLGPFEWISYGAVHKMSTDFASGVTQLKLPPKAAFGMYTANCMEFQIVTLGMFSQGFTCVPVYDTLGDNIVQYECNHAELPIMFVEAKKLKSIAGVLSACPTLKYVVVLTAIPADEPLKATFESAGVTLTDLPTLQQKGAAAPVKPAPSTGDDLAFIMYTSGTTGDPKGVMIKQLSITIGASYCAGIELFPTDRYLSYLPLAHIFETMVEHAALSVGGSIGFYSGDIKKVQDDIVTLQPTLFVGVPRIYQRFYEAAEAKIGASPLKPVVNFLLKKEIANARTGKKTFYGKLLAKILGAKITGGQVRLMISGAAPLPIHVHEFLLAAMGCPVVQGYGMTENAANATLPYLDDWHAGHVGPPMPTCEVKLVDVAEMNYTTAENSSGEVCTRGACNFAGYFKNKEETDKVLDADGWLHTGDIGRWNPEGTLSIIDRKKNIFKLSQGEYVAAEKIEMCVSKSKYISQPWIYGNSFFPMLVAVCTPDFVELHKAAAAGGWDDPDPVKLAAKKEAQDFILKCMVEEGKAAKLKTFELPKAIILEGNLNELNQGFSIANDCLTPTFKLKRPQLLKRYQAQINAMYTSLGEDPTKSR